MRRYRRVVRPHKDRMAPQDREEVFQGEKKKKTPKAPESWFESVKAG